MSTFSTGVSALGAFQRAMDVIGNNIANANTPGFHRQVAQFKTRGGTVLGNLSIGDGVTVAGIRRQRSLLVETALTRHTFESSQTSAQLNSLRQIESLFTPGPGSIDGLMEDFFNQVEQLSARPDNAALRQVVLGSAQALAAKINTVSNDFDHLRENADVELRAAVAEVNAKTRQIAVLNADIRRNQARGVESPDQKDELDRLVSDLAELINVRAIEQSDGSTLIMAAGAPVVVGESSTDLTVGVDTAGKAFVALRGSTDGLQVEGGKAGGLLRVRNEVLPDLRNRLDSLVGEFTHRVDAVHATGLGRIPGLTNAAGQRPVSNISIPLDQAGTAFPIQSGSLFVSVTELATGQRRIAEVVVDPTTQNLKTLANAITAVGNLQAVADPQTRTLRIFAQPGYTFDFAGRLPSSPNVNITGTTVPTVGGQFTGGYNDTFTFEFLGSGTVGVTPGLQVRVKNGNGDTLATVNVGQGYSPGDEIDVLDGINFRLASGTANAGDSFDIRVTGQPDTAGVLAALGVNTFFAGSNASNVRVNPEVAADVDRLAASKSGQPADGANLRALAGLRGSLLLDSNTRTFRQFYAAIVGDVGTQVRQLDQQQTGQQVLTESLLAQQQSISGVDTNEELVQLLQFQKSFQLAATYISVVNETLEDLVRIAQ